jgi:hypothetical protein
VLINLDEGNGSELEDLETSRGFGKFIALGLIALVGGLGFTFAANIGLGSSSNIEFGQGVQKLATCDDNISVKPNVEFRNNVNPPGFYLSKFDISGVSAACIGKEFILTAYDETGTVVNLKPSPPYRSLRFHFDGSGWQRDADGCWWLDAANATYLNASNNSVQVGTCGLGFYNQNVSTASKMRFTLETYERTTAAITISFPTSLNVGYSLSYKSQGDTYATGFEDGFINDYTYFPNTAESQSIALFIRLSDADYANSSVNGSSRTITRTSGSTCSYVGKIDANMGLISSGKNNGLTGPPFKALEYSCPISSNDTVSIQ